MSSSRTSCSTTNSKQRKHFSVERRPLMLKDFLKDDSNSCSSSGFKSFPRRVEDRSMRNLTEIDLNTARNSSPSSYSSNTKRLLRSRSKAAASSTISAFQAIINTVRSIQFNAVKSPSILPRSLSRKLSKKSYTQKRSENKENEVKIIVRVKDIIRWKSFRDLEEENSQPSDLISWPDHHCTATTTESTNSPRSSCNGSSWCDSDFTWEYLPSWSGNSECYSVNEVKMGKKISPCVGRDSMEATKIEVGPKELQSDEEKEQRSPVSVLDFECEEDEDSHSSFNKTLANLEKTQQKLIQKIRRFESLAKLDPINLDKCTSVEDNDEHEEDDSEREEEYTDEEMAMLLLNHVKETSSIGSFEDNVVEQLLLDFFVEELSTKRNQIIDDEIDSEIIRLAKIWINGEHSGRINWEACVRDMEKKLGKWCKFEEEKEETALQIENGVLNLLVDEVLIDLFL